MFQNYDMNAFEKILQTYFSQEYVHVHIMLYFVPFAYGLWSLIKHKIWLIWEKVTHACVYNLKV